MVSQVKIGIICYKPYFLCGFDQSSQERLLYRKQIKNILQNLKSKNNIVGYTGLDIGFEQDFAEICIEEKIDYCVILPHQSQELKWKNLSEDILDNYNFLIKNAFKVKCINSGGYAPKKSIMKKLNIIQECTDIILFKSKNLNQNIYEDQIKKLNKKLHIINVV